MTARELAALLPPTLLRFDGVSPDQPVPLPLEPLRQSMQAGRPVLRLSQIHEACPMLFQRPPQPGEDVEVTLPLARVKGILEGTGPLPSVTDIFAPAAASAPPANPFAAIPPQRFNVSAPVSTGAAASGNPFAQMPAAPTGNSPFAPAAAGNPPPSHGAAGSPFSAVPPAFPAPPSQPPAALPEKPAAVAGNPFAPIIGNAAALPPAAAPVAWPAPAAGSAPAPAPVSAPAPAPLPASAPAPSPFAVANPAPAARVTARVPSPFSVASAPVARPPVPEPTAFPPAAAAPAPASPVPSAPLQPSPFSPVVPAAAATPPAMPPLLGVRAPGAAPSGAVPSSSGGFPLPAMPAGQAQAPLAWPPAAAPVTPQPRLSAPVPGHKPGLTSPAPAPSTAAIKAGPPPLIASNLPPVSTSSPFLAVNHAPPASAPVVPPVQPVSAPLAAVLPITTPVIKAAAPSAPVFPAAPSAPLSRIEEEKVNLSLRAVLRDADPAQLGFSPDNVPESVRVDFDLFLLAKQLSTGRVAVSIEAIRAGIPEKFRPAFARSAEGLQVVIPMSEVFHNLPESARPALEPATPEESHLSITTSPFQTPFAIKAEEENKQLLDLSVTGFDPANRPQRPNTQPVPLAELPPAPLPPVLPVLQSQGGAPPVHVELPTLRPVASATPPVAENGAPSRPNLLSRPPGSGTAPTPPRSAPRLKTVPASPTALKAFPKPAGAPPNGSYPPDVAPPPLLPALPSLPAFPATPLPPETDTAAASAEALPPPLAVELPALPPIQPPVATLSPAAPASWPANREMQDDLGQSFSAASLSAEPPPRAGSAPVQLPAAQQASTPVPPLVTPPLLAEITAPAPAPTPAAVAAPADNPVEASAQAQVQPASWQAAPEVSNNNASDVPSGVEDLSFGAVSDIRQLTLRAVLGTDQVLTPQDIVDRCAALPGLKACALFSQHDVVISQGMDPATAQAFRSSAAQTRDSLRSLADSLGLGAGGNFTLRTDHGVRSFFLEPNLTLAIQHEQPAFQPGTREKLILITQELARD